MSLSTPRGWVFAVLADVAHWSSGGTPSRANPKFFAGTIPWIKTGELGPQFIRSTEEYISEDAIAASSAKVFPKGAVALAMYGATIGKASILAVDASTNQACAVGVPDTVSSEFLYYFLLSQREAFVDAGKGGAQPNISQGIVKGWPILVPPLAEQARIIEKLEELLSDLDAGVAELKAAQRKLAQYRQSLLKAAVEGALTADWRAARARSGEPQESGADLLQRILTERRARWEAKQLAKYAEQGKTPPEGWQDKYKEPVEPDTTDLPALPDGWAWASLDQVVAESLLGIDRGKDHQSLVDGNAGYIKMNNVSMEGSVDTSALVRVEASPDEIERYSLVSGDLLFNTRNSRELVGKTGIIQEVDAATVYNNNLMRLRLDGSITPAFACHQMCSATFRGRMEKIKKATTSVAAVYAKDLFPLPVVVPPMEEQKAINEMLVEFLSAVDQQEASVQRGLRQAAAQRKNILKAAFTGQLVPQDANDEPASALLERIRAERALQTAEKKPRQRQRKEAP